MTGIYHLLRENAEATRFLGGTSDNRWTLDMDASMHCPFADGVRGGIISFVSTVVYTYIHIGHSGRSSSGRTRDNSISQNRSYHSL